MLEIVNPAQFWAIAPIHKALLLYNRNFIHQDIDSTRTSFAIWELASSAA